MLQQGEFDTFVENYNADLVFLLNRASGGDYNCLISSFTVLKDLYEVILKLHETLHLELRIKPQPIALRDRNELLNAFGYDPGQIANIQGFLDYVERTQGKAFEKVLEERAPTKCVKTATNP